MGFYREFKDTYLQCIDLVSGISNINENNIANRAFSRNCENISNADHSISGEICGTVAGIYTDLLSAFTLPLGLYAYQKLKE